jgi:transposase
VHLLVNGDGEPLEFRLSAGQRSDYTQAIALLGQRRAHAVIADRGYDSSAIVSYAKNMGAIVVIPSKINRRQQRPHDRNLYKLRNRIERCFNQLKQFRRFATRYCKYATSFAATVTIACSWIHLKQFVDTP